MHRRRRTTVVAVAMSAALLVSACGDSGGDSSGATASSGSPDKSEIVLGTIGSYSSPQGGTVAGAADVMAAWVEMVNGTGGIDGHRVRLVTKDDAGDPGKALTLVKEMVQRDKVAAIVGASSFVDATWAKYVEGRGVPVIGGSPYGLPMLTNPSFFSVGTNVVAQRYGMVVEAKRLGDKFANLYCAEAPICASGATLDQAFAPRLGVDTPLMQKVSASQPNYSAVCKAVKDSGVQSYTITHSSAIGIRIAETCRDQGVTAINLTTGGEADNAWLTRPKLDRTRNVELAAPYFDASSEGTKGYRDFVAEHLPDFGVKDGPGPQYAYIGAKLFEAAVKAAPADKVTAETVKQGLYSLKGETLGGLTAPLTFEEGQPTANNCWFISEIKDGRWTAPQGVKYECAPDDVVGPEIEKLRGGAS